MLINIKKQPGILCQMQKEKEKYDRLNSETMPVL